MPMSKKVFLIAAVMMVITILGGLFYWLKQHGSEIAGSNTVVLGQPIIKWQKITITESDKNTACICTRPE